MNYKEATELKNKNEHLIGQKYRGSIIEEIIIRPSNEKEYDFFVKSYLRTLNANSSIAPFLESDLTVNVICDKAKIKTHNLFLITEIEKLLDENLDVKF